MRIYNDRIIFFHRDPAVFGPGVFIIRYRNIVEIFVVQYRISVCLFIYFIVIIFGPADHFHLQTSAGSYGNGFVVIDRKIQPYLSISSLVTLPGVAHEFRRIPCTS